LTKENKALAAIQSKRQFAKSPGKSRLAFLTHDFKNWRLNAEADFVTAVFERMEEIPVAHIS
jgi:hypothetical protein